MSDEVIYRDFKESDIPELSEILGDTWFGTFEEELKREAGLQSLASFLCRATFIRVAEYHGEVVGIVAASSGNPSQESLDYWHSLEKDSLERVKNSFPEVEKNLVAYYTRFEAAHDNMLSQCDDLGLELTLFAVSEKSRGLGVGTNLYKQALAYFAEIGAKRMYLFTDTDCTWQYYEHRGMKRVAKHVSTEEELKFLFPEELYIYTLDITGE